MLFSPGTLFLPPDLFPSIGTRRPASDDVTKTTFTFHQLTDKDNPLKGKPRLTESDLSDSEVAEINAKIVELVVDGDTGAVSENFLQIQKQTECVFAKKARIWSAAEWNDNLDIGQLFIKL